MTALCKHARPSGLDKLYVNTLAQGSAYSPANKYTHLARSSPNENPIVLFCTVSISIPYNHRHIADNRSEYW